MKQVYKYLVTVCLTLFVAFALPQVVQASIPVDLAAYGSEGYNHLDWDVSVDTQVYKNTHYKIYRGTASGFQVGETSLIRNVYESTEFDDYSIESKKNYYYVVAVVDTELGELGRSAEVSATPNASQPHGYYDNKTTKCSVCHSSHEGKGADLINVELSSAEDLCKICHEENGVSKLIIDPPAEDTTLQNCNQCHNPHGNNKNREFVPMLLQVTIDGKVLFEALNPKTKKVGNDFCLTSECHADYKDFTYQPPEEGQAHDSIAMVDEQGTDSTTGISCSGCHSKHKYGAQKMLRREISWKDNPIFTNIKGLYQDDKPEVTEYNSFCESCHKEAAGAYRGSENYNSAALNVHSGVACSGCHDPHGVGKDKYLKRDYANTSTGDIEGDFALCLTCHDNRVTTSQGEVTTRFAIKYENETVNLHAYHLQENSPRALCKDCHSPHGPADAMNISFPTSNTGSYLKAYNAASNRPEFNFISSGYGSCNLICHGVTHTEENSKYDSNATIQSKPQETEPIIDQPDTGGSGTSQPDAGEPAPEAPGGESTTDKTYPDDETPPPSVSDGAY